VRGGKHFDPKNPLELQGVNMHAAFYNTMKCINGNIYINLNPSIKFFQQERLSDTFYNLNNPKKISDLYVG